MQVGLCNLFVQHTSASLTINENASPDVPLDLNVHLYLPVWRLEMSNVLFAASSIPSVVASSGESVCSLPLVGSAVFSHRVQANRSPCMRHLRM